MGKLMTLTNGKTSQGVKDFLGTDIVPKGAKFYGCSAAATSTTTQSI